jgi:hypothetical protein
MSYEIKFIQPLLVLSPTTNFQLACQWLVLSAAAARTMERQPLAAGITHDIEVIWAKRCDCRSGSEFELGLGGAVVRMATARAHTGVKWLDTGTTVTAAINRTNGMARSVWTVN